MYTRDEENEILYPNSGYCESFKRWFEYVLNAQGVNLIEGYQARQEEMGRILGMNCSDKPAIAVHVRDIVATMIVSQGYDPQDHQCNFWSRKLSNWKGKRSRQSWMTFDRGFFVCFMLISHCYVKY